MTFQIKSSVQANQVQAWDIFCVSYATTYALSTGFVFLLTTFFYLLLFIRVNLSYVNCACHFFIVLAPHPQLTFMRSFNIFNNFNADVG